MIIFHGVIFPVYPDSCRAPQVGWWWWLGNNFPTASGNLKAVDGQALFFMSHVLKLFPCRTRDTFGK